MAAGVGGKERTQVRKSKNQSGSLEGGTAKTNLGTEPGR